MQTTAQKPATPVQPPVFSRSMAEILRRHEPQWQVPYVMLAVAR